MSQLFKGLDPGPMVAEIQARIGEELDYRIEAGNQQAFADFYDGHLHPRPRRRRAVVGRSGADHGPRDRRGLGRAAHVEPGREGPGGGGDLPVRVPEPVPLPRLQRRPPPGNYVFRPGGNVSFLDFGLVKHFDERAMQTFQAMIGSAVLEPDHARFRNAVEDAGLLQPGAPVSYRRGRPLFAAHFYEAVRRDPDHHLDRRTPRPPSGGRSAGTPPSRDARRCLPTSSSSSASTSGSPPSSKASAPRELPQDRGGAHGRWVNGPPSTPMGQAEAAWLAARSAGVGTQSGSMA